MTISGHMIGSCGLTSASVRGKAALRSDSGDVVVVVVKVVVVGEGSGEASVFT